MIDIRVGITMAAAGIVLGAFIGWNLGRAGIFGDCDVMQETRNGPQVYTCTPVGVEEGRL